MKPVRIHDAARAEIVHEALYYKAVSQALAQRFVKAVEDAIALAAEFPAMGTAHKHGTRRCYPKKFPFSVVYLDRQDEIYVLAIAPFSRKPDYWKSRRVEG
ncbi:type II toxin-antitoxin system RelE/ParE family toxin [Pseudorhodoferax soli]|uniref:ParE-like toxin of type II ParDE toxin-antitoxin system n=1 Tax=Pseudorhodoferax soli TaxID=545864 RepID=A0A368XUV8_9BURK|nr:type II toxin-antitoxin system RelE/ParE family toxin [Pseudorhodoferax soli]RCW71279.1 ParE-like toxin of type II ParDE toxin-antitoxin system [Pseudorhodoferax soli]